MNAHSVSRETLAALTSAQKLQITRVLAALEADEHAPTAIRERGQASQAHIADSLAALELNALSGARRIADLGSGAGFPGLALAVALPEAEVSLIESQRRKCEFLERLCAAAGVENARVVCARAEEWGAGRSANDVVVARALAPQTVVLEYAAPLLRTGGRLIDWRGKRDESAEREADRAAALLGLARDELRRVSPFEGASDRHLHVFTKVRETPQRFPRRAGIARKRPLGS
ncbi:MAG TPA: 16S rRNA (guanine(527)-N(7))-methyltransferase RsmG [Solirubrobacteraceae bacterium]|jgi:16S rRNA (guanine527-N7)-methyltransferase|nr:16S rRNA (guanine(527)-N(7))-methyltransferase RsmG [Solirubrobacteraceae bacterium]